VRSWLQRPLVRILPLVGIVLVVLFAAFSGTSLRATASTGVAPNGTGEMDCNGWSNTYKSVKPQMRALCTDPWANVNGKASRFYDNNYYVGHDEPSVKFISSAPNSANTMSYSMRLAVDPPGTPTVSPNGTTVSDYAELSAAPWFGLPICDPNSYPQNPCSPDSDTNTGMGASTDAGSAFMELQFYPPGYGTFVDAFSCDPTHYCAALTIDSLECSYNFGYCNRACVEPVNFAYIQMDGIPTGPPSPQLSNVSTLLPNSHTLLMNQGDALRVVIKDTSGGLRTEVDDLSTGQAGYMIASATNGFMNTNLHTCDGTPFTFHAEYNTAAVQNQVPWAALEGGVLMEDELGHFEPCSSVSNSLPLSYNLGGQSFSDPQSYQTCNGAFEPGGAGEGPCSASGCHNSTTEGNLACPRGGLCEQSDANCFPAGPRPVTINGVTQTVTWPVAGCLDDYYQNGDLDFEGSSYIADWPDGSATHPTPFQYTGPFDAAGNPYPSVQFETDLAGSEQDCNVSTGSGCTAPPAGSAFYPFWTIGKQSSISGGGKVCAWNFGNVIANVTTSSFGGDAEYGTPDTARYAGTLTSPVLANPQLSASCSG
jgi:hypothetical protein